MRQVRGFLTVLWEYFFLSPSFTADPRPILSPLVFCNLHPRKKGVWQSALVQYTGGLTSLIPEAEFMKVQCRLGFWS
jgi:hypothetical protein